MMIYDRSLFHISYKKNILLKKIERKVSSYALLNASYLEYERAERSKYIPFSSRKESIRSFLFQKKKVEKDEVKEKGSKKIEGITRKLRITDLKHVKERDSFHNRQTECSVLSEKVIPYLCVLGKDSEKLTEKENFLNLFRILLNEKETDSSFNYFYAISKIYRETIKKENIENTELKDFVKRNVDFIIKQRKFEFLFQCFEMLAIYKICDDLHLLEKILFLIIKNQRHSEEERIIYSYYIVKYLKENGIYRKLAINVIYRYLLLQPFFWNFLEKFNYENAFILFCQYAISCNIKPSFLILERYIRCFNNTMTKGFQLKYLNGKKGLISFQSMLLSFNFYSSDFNSIVKRYIDFYLSLLNPSDVLLLSSNMFLSFTKCDYIFLETKKTKSFIRDDRFCRNADNSIVKNNQKSNDDDHDDYDCFSTLRKDENDNHEKKRNTCEIKKDERKYRNHKYLSFLSLKYLADKSIRTTDNFLSNLNTQHIYHYFILASFCHFSLFSNWWADTSIYLKLKNRKKKFKKMRKSRLQDKNHFVEKVSHLLEALLYKFGYFQRKENHEISTSVTNSLKEEHSIESPSKRVDYVNPFENIASKTKLIHAFPYLLKSFVRVSVFNNIYFLKYSDRLFLFFYDVFAHCIHLNVIQYELQDEQLRKKHELKEEVKDKLSLYEISSICESFYILQNLLKQKNTELYISDLFEKALYIYLNKIHFFFFKKNVDLHLLTGDHIKNILRAYLDVDDPIYNYYLLLKLILPILCDDYQKNYLKCTRVIIANILSLPFVSSSSHLFEQKEKKKNCGEGEDELIEGCLIHTIFKNFQKWENYIISVNTQRRIRKKTKKKYYIFDFIYANEYMRLSFIFILCLNKMVKKKDIYDNFLSYIFDADMINTEKKETFKKIVNDLYDSFDIPFRKKKQKKANALVDLHRLFVTAYR